MVKKLENMEMSDKLEETAVALFCYRWHFAAWFGKCHRKPIPCYSDLPPSSMMKHFYPDAHDFFQDDNAHPQGTRDH